MGVFERYTEEARRAIFFARAEAMLRKAPAISVAHLLLGLSWEEQSLANYIAKLKDRLPELCSRMGTPLRPCTDARLSLNPEIPLDKESKMTLAYAVNEADWEWCDRIDTDHLLRGILRFSNVASDALNFTGIEIDAMRSAAQEYRKESSKGARKLRWLLGFAWDSLKPALVTLGYIAGVGLLVVLIVRLVNR